ncbi:MAG: amino acid ABC transporter permease [Candidatus Borkfalkiaceae bacterium]|nr:amino acid ABC transporter permease [Christensenellaceae bacterium]
MWDKINNALIVDGRWKWYFEGIGNTLLISLVAIAIGLLIGMTVALIRYVNKKFGKFKILSKIGGAYLTVFRGTPVYVQLLIMYLIVLAACPSNLIVAVLTFGINSGAYVAEIFRAGLESVDDGQIEAGVSLGLNVFKVMVNIVLPQAIRRSLPTLCNEFISLIKETSIVGTIGVVDITKVAERIINKVYEPFVPYIVIALLYLVIVVVLTKLLKMLEVKLAKSDRG